LRGDSPTRAEVERLRAEARTDPLTKLPNRRAFEADLSAHMEQANRTGTVFSVLAIDLDALKEINDTQGHHAGDARIRWAAATLTVAIGRRGSSYRTGGDEFMVLLPRTRALDGVEVAHRVQRAAAVGGFPRALSIGVAESSSTHHRHELVRNADRALYVAKREQLLVAAYRPELQDEPSPTTAGRRNTGAHALIVALRARDDATATHSEDVAELAAAVGQRLGLHGRRLEQLRRAALLHDIGVIGVPDALLHKAVPLSDAEQLAFERHASCGPSLVAAAGFVDESTWVLHQHARYDGGGRRSGGPAREIPLESRIIAVADAYATATGEQTDRVSVEEALKKLQARAGKSFDPRCVDALAATVQTVSATGSGGEHEDERAVPRRANKRMAS
jgi:diguanylate cyclase (GGDEF)-like protein